MTTGEAAWVGRMDGSGLVVEYDNWGSSLGEAEWMAVV